MAITLCCGAQASHCGIFSYCRPWSVGCASFSSCGVRALGCRVSSRGAWHGLSFPTGCGIFPDQGWKPCLLHWQADDFLTTGPPGKSSDENFNHLAKLFSSFSRERFHCCNLQSVRRYLKPAVFVFFIKLSMDDVASTDDSCVHES